MTLKDLHHRLSIDPGTRASAGRGDGAVGRAAERAVDQATGSVEELAVAAESELCRLREQSESWRRAELAWQDWAAALLAEAGLQPEGGQMGDRCAREAIAEALYERRR